MKDLSEDADASANWSKWLTPLVCARQHFADVYFFGGASFIEREGCPIFLAAGTVETRGSSLTNQNSRRRFSIDPRDARAASTLTCG